MKAWNARSTKATLEYYFDRVGFVSVGAFRRDIDNFFVSTVIPATPEFLALHSLDGEEYAGYDVSTQINSPEKVRMEGYNLNYKQALTFLPEWARGVQLFANFNALRATGTGAGNFGGYIPRTVNWGLSLSRPKYNLKINWHHRGRARDSAITGRGIEAGTYNWSGQRMYVDVGADYNLTKRIALLVSVRNLNSMPERTEAAGPSTPDAMQLLTLTNYGAVWVFGVKGSF
ncbi:MAG: TonB-dependent receptor [Verrucomicrobia bacterium]|nr:TonB-dependent receptor [Verrucomicrobiota bacterium]